MYTNRSLFPLFARTYRQSRCAMTTRWNGREGRTRRFLSTKNTATRTQTLKQSWEGRKPGREPNENDHKQWKPRNSGTLPRPTGDLYQSPYRTVGRASGRSKPAAPASGSLILKRSAVDFIPTHPLQTSHPKFEPLACARHASTPGGCRPPGVDWTSPGLKALAGPGRLQPQT